MSKFLATRCIAVPPSRAKGIALMLGAGVCWSLGGIIVRSLTHTQAWEIVFWRTAFMVMFLGVLLLLLRGRSAWTSMRAVGAAGVMAGACLATQIGAFIFALQFTSAANTFVLMSLSPLFAALVGLLFLREPMAPRTWIAVAVALLGVALMFGEGLNRGHWIGNLLALCVPVAYACQILCVRKVSRRSSAAPDLLPTLLIGGVMAMLPALWLAWPLTAHAPDVALLALMGCVQLGLGCWLMTLAVPHLSAAQMGLLALTETILAPLWVWLGVGEAPGALAGLGAVLIVGALLVNGWVTLRGESAPGK